MDTVHFTVNHHYIISFILTFPAILPLSILITLGHKCCCCCCCYCCLIAKSCLTLLRPHGLQPTTLLCPWHFPDKNTGVGCHFLLQGIFLTQDRTCLLDWQADFTREALCHQHSESTQTLIHDTLCPAHSAQWHADVSNLLFCSPSQSVSPEASRVLDNCTFFSDFSCSPNFLT